MSRASLPGVVLTMAASGVLAGPRDLGKNYAAPVELGEKLVGTRPPEWALGEWINSEPLTLAGLRGKPVLVRWWTAPDCPFCAASADALNELWRAEQSRGLVIVGAYHHKAKTPLTREHVVAHAGKFGFRFPVAIDRDWKTLENWWLHKVERGWTSVTFVLDRAGVIRHVHGGGAYFDGEPGLAALRAAIAAVLREAPPQ